MEEVIITKRVLEIKKKKDRDGEDLFELSRKEYATAGTMNTEPRIRTPTKSGT
jgi:hypothetical protein